jgi:lipid-binding SYLF domain-containing protein
VAAFSFRIGGEETGVVTLVMNKRGADGSVAAGSVGRTTQADTDLQMHAETLTYSRSRGVFAGVALDGV